MVFSIGRKWFRLTPNARKTLRSFSCWFPEFGQKPTPKNTKEPRPQVLKFVFSQKLGFFQQKGRARPQWKNKKLQTLHLHYWYDKYLIIYKGFRHPRWLGMGFLNHQEYCKVKILSTIPIPFNIQFIPPSRSPWKIAVDQKLAIKNLPLNLLNSLGNLQNSRPSSLPKPWKHQDLFGWQIWGQSSPWWNLYEPIPSLKLTASLHLKIDDWKANISLWDGG